MQGSRMHGWGATVYLLQQGRRLKYRAPCISVYEPCTQVPSVCTQVVPRGRKRIQTAVQQCICLHRLTPAAFRCPPDRRVSLSHSRMRGGGSSKETRVCRMSNRMGLDPALQPMDYRQRRCIALPLMQTALTRAGVPATLAQQRDLRGYHPIPCPNPLYGSTYLSYWHTLGTGHPNWAVSRKPGGLPGAGSVLLILASPRMCFAYGRGGEWHALTYPDRQVTWLYLPGVEKEARGPEGHIRAGPSVVNTRPKWCLSLGTTGLLLASPIVGLLPYNDDVACCSLLSMPSGKYEYSKHTGVK